MAMLSPYVHHHSSESSTRALFVLKRPSFSNHGSTSIPFLRKFATAAPNVRKSKGGIFRANTISNRIQSRTTQEKTISVKGIINVKVVAGGLFNNLSLTRSRDDIADLLGKSLILELISADKGGDEGQTIKGYARKIFMDIDDATYQCNLQVPESFGEVAAVFVDNEHSKEMYIKDIVLEKLPNGPITITCDSWVAPTPKRLFFTNKSYLPSETPIGLKKLREKELKDLRGDGTGERKISDRIYDYDVYNDIGDPDKDASLARPVLGGNEFPYPRRCRTGRGPTKTDPLSEKRAKNVYVPRDEEFESVKSFTFQAKALKTALKAVIPTLETTLVDPDLRFPHFTRIDSLFDEGIPLPGDKGNIFQTVLPRLINAIDDGADNVLLFQPPELINRDKFAWFRDEEVGRQTLAGLNPYSIELVTEWPMRSKLDPEEYGPAESAITTEIINEEIRGIMTVEEALKQKRLFVLDYHDLYLPYVQKIRELKGRTLYGSRTLFFLTEGSILRPVAIELTRPKMGDIPQWRHVYVPSWDASKSWLWRFAKAHAAAHDAGYHQLVIHWLRTHCCMEPYILAANRQLSSLHPIFRLLHPHFRYTMEINARAREDLINADGLIEGCFTPGKYSVELSSVAYKKLWRFDMESLPADLIRRGMAVEDPTAEHGLKLVIEDYPFANDGLLLWDSIKTWVGDYVNHYYDDDKTVENDTELQAFWTEVRTKGHGDKKDEPWWPVLNTIENLVQTLSTIIWVGSGHHAAVNFGQYMYGGYFPSRPTIARTNMPNESPGYGDIEDRQFYKFVTKPEGVLLNCFPSQTQASKVITVLDVLSTHSPDEEYIGQSPEPSWAENQIINAAFERFQGRLKELEGIIDERNSNPKNQNRVGAGVVPYELLKPFSKPGATGMGVPNSVSI